MTSTSSDDLDLWVQELGAFFRSPFSSVGTRAFQFGLSSSKWLLRALALLFILASCLFAASVVFTWIYFTMIPVKHFEKPIYFDFSRESPEALVSLMGNQWQYRTPSPYNLQPVMTFLTSGVPYDVDIEFSMARRVAGSQSGMLMIEATAEHSYRDKVQPVAHSKRPIEIGKINFVAHLVRDCFLLVPIMTGLYRPSFRVKTRIFERFVDFQQFPISTMNLTLIRAPDHLGEIHLTDATLTFNLYLSGWRYLFYTYFWTSALFLIPVFAIIIFLIFITSYFIMKSPKTTSMDRIHSRKEDADRGFDYKELSNESPSPSKHRQKYVSPLLSTVDPQESNSKEKELSDDGDDFASETCTSDSDSEPTRDPSKFERNTRNRRDSVPLANHSDLVESDQKIADDEDGSNFHIVNHEFEDDITVSSSLDTTGTVPNS